MGVDDGRGVGDNDAGLCKVAIYVAIVWRNTDGTKVSFLCVAGVEVRAHNSSALPIDEPFVSIDYVLSIFICGARSKCQDVVCGIGRIRC